MRRPATLTALLAVALQGCASTTPHAPAPAHAPSSSALLVPGAPPEASAEALAALARREQTQPRALPANDPVWALLGAEPPTTPRASDERAAATLDRALAALGPSPASPAPQGGVSEQDREDAAYLLSTALGELADGDADTALQSLERAAAIDPASPTITDARVRALSRLGRRAEAADLAAQAIRQGSDDPLSLVVAGLSAHDRAEHESAARLLGRAISAEAPGLEASVGAVAMGALGQSLLELGWVSAGATALSEALTDAPQPASDHLLRTDLVRLLGRREALWTRVGESLRDIDPEAALTAFSNAGKALDNNAGLAETRMSVLISSGRPSQAALDTLDEIARTGRPPSRSETALFRALGRIDEARPALIGALLHASRAPSITSPTPSAGLLIAAAELSPPGQAQSILTLDGGDRAYNDTLARALLTDGRLDAEEQAARAEGLIRRYPEQYRLIAAAMLAGPTAPTRLREAVHALPERWSLRLLSVGLDLQLRRWRDAFAQAESLGAAPDIARDLAVIETAAHVGRWDVVNTTLDALDGAPPSPALVRALRAGHRFEAARETAERLETEDQLDVTLLLELAELAAQLELPRDAELYLEMASELDPYDERGLGARLALYAPGAALADTTQHARVLRAIRERAPDGVYARLLRAQELARSGILVESEQQLRAIAESNPDERAAFELLHQIWTSQDDPALIRSAIAWLEALTRQRPGSPAPSGALARLLAGADRYDEAMAALDECERHAASPVMARLRERLMRNHGLDAEATEHALARLDHPTLSIDDTLERAEVLLGKPELERALDTLTRGLPEGIALTPAQRTRLTRIATVAVSVFGASAAGQTPLASVARPTLGVIELTIDRVRPLPWSVHNARIALTAFGDMHDVETIARVCEDSITASPEQAYDAYLVAARSLLSTGRVSDAVSVAARGAVRDGYLGEQLFTDALTITAQSGDVGDARALIDHLDTNNLIGPAARMVRPEPDTPLDTPAAQRAELAYQIASIGAFLGRDELSEGAYRLALEYDPGHAWSNNDLGYMLVDTGADVAGGEALIARAHAALPDSPNVTDSLAWARYKLGWLRDTPEGAGAITLLRRAIELQIENDRGNATLHDHLGDALWRDGQGEAARDAWLDAESVALEQTRQMRREQSARAALERLEDRLRSVRRKLRAVQVGEAPPVAPLADEPAPDTGG